MKNFSIEVNLEIHLEVFQEILNRTTFSIFKLDIAAHSSDILSSSISKCCLGVKFNLYDSLDSETCRALILSLMLRMYLATRQE